MILCVFVSLEFTENTELLKKRMAELRLYCDLLVQHVDKTKEMGLSSVPESEVNLIWLKANNS